MRSFKAAVLAGVALLVIPVQQAAADRDDNRRNSGWWTQNEDVFLWQPRERDVRRKRQRQPAEAWWSDPFQNFWQRPSRGWWIDRSEPGQYRAQGEANFEPEPEVAQGAEIYDYKADRLVPLGDPKLVFSPAQGDEPSISTDRLVDPERRRAQAYDPSARALYDALKTQSSGVRVTEKQSRAIVEFYRARGFAPLWTRHEGPVEGARRVLTLMSKAAEEGLDPAEYLPVELTGFSDDLAALKESDERLTRFELGVTAAALRYAMHASGGRIIPNRLSGYHDLNPPTVDPGKALRKLADAKEPDSYLASLHPTHRAYAAFKQALAKFNAEGTVAFGAPIPEGSTLRPGENDPRVPQIRARLAALGHLARTVEPAAVEAAETPQPEFGAATVTGSINPPEDSAAAGLEFYGQDLVDAVKALQSGAGLKPDGIIGPKTIAALNVDNSATQRRQLELAMERIRWLPRELGAKHVLVNQAAFTAQVVEGGHITWQTKVVVGKPNTQTAEFSDEMETVVLNPYWGVPGSIITHEMLPLLKRDPDYLDREGYEVVDASGEVVSSSSIDWWNVGQKLPDVRQPPGPSNALGEIKFLFPNKHSIYMHDTPSKNLFTKSMRAFSHGCVRVENPRHFAEVLLGWDQERLAQELASGHNQSVPLAQKVPVHMTYFTAWPREDGSVAYFADVYGRDARLELALEAEKLALR